jgi:alginate O-acetyltransferase complex protein AlgJ
MATPEQPLPAGGRSREEIAQIEMDSTAVASATVRFLMAFFLTAIAVVPIVEWAGVRMLGAEGAATAWSRLSGLPGEIRSHLAGATLRLRSGQAAAAEDPGAWSLVVSTNRIAIAGLSAFERSLEADSLLGRLLRPPAQLVMTGWLGVGNERVYRGRDGWLFYRPDVEYTTGRGFLDPAQLRRRVAAAPEWTAPPQPDPREAIARFRRDLAARGITLIVMPTPLKPGVHPEMLAVRYADATGTLQNPSYRAFVDDLRRDGVLVFDVSEALAAARRSGQQYLMTDTHWRPETMEGVAELLGGFIAAHVRLPATADPGYRLERPEVRNTGDVVRMLDLPADSPLFPPEAVFLRRVLQPDGSPWRSSRDADVFVLGDSFSNIYALESMGWGTSAGFAEQLSYTLRRPVDRLVQNDEGAFATRDMLRRDLDRLNGKRLVVYQFAARELAFGDWKVIPLSAPQAGAFDFERGSRQATMDGQHPSGDARPSFASPDTP